MLRWVLGRFENAGMARLSSFAEGLTEDADGTQRKLIQKVLELRNLLGSLLAGNCILLKRTGLRIFTFHNEPFLRQLILQIDYSYTALMSVLELPVT